MPRPPFYIPVRLFRSAEMRRREEIRAWKALFLAAACILGATTAFYLPWLNTCDNLSTGMGEAETPLSVSFGNGNDITEKTLPPGTSLTPPPPMEFNLPVELVMPAIPSSTFLEQELPEQSAATLKPMLGTEAFAGVIPEEAIPSPVREAPAAAPHQKQRRPAMATGGTPGARRSGGRGNSSNIAQGETTKKTDRVRVRYREAPKPPYPVSLRMARSEGSVRVRISVSPDGRPTSVDILSGSGFPEMDTTASRWILAHWRFHPETVGGRAVPSIVTTSIHFELK